MCILLIYSTVNWSLDKYHQTPMFEFEGPPPETCAPPHTPQPLCIASAVVLLY